jgi:arsenate reductase-like glutaredoxin family protein
MNIQIIGTKKCKETQKAERFFKERRIPFHFRDLNEKGLSKGELDNITHKINIEDLLDTESKVYKEKGMMYMKFDLSEELLNEPLLLKTPIVRFNKLVSIGYQPEIWQKWLDETK